jgi:hypothetical protein
LLKAIVALFLLLTPSWVLQASSVISSLLTDM